MAERALLRSQSGKTPVNLGSFLKTTLNVISISPLLKVRLCQISLEGGVPKICHSLDHQILYHPIPKR